MKYVVIGDIHGEGAWHQVIEAEPNYDKIIFLGDYVSTHKNISQDEQCSNLEDILNFKRENPDKVVLLRGNHDIQHLGYYWAECSGFFPKVAEYMISIREEFLKLTQWIYLDEKGKFLFSHAGVSKTWFRSTGVKKMSDINTLEPSELFGFTPENSWDMYGYSKTQPCTWIRPKALAEDCSVRYTQIVGHTPVSLIVSVTGDAGRPNIWLCDNFPKQYLVIEDGLVTPKYLGIPEISLPNRYRFDVKLVQTEDSKEWILKCDENAGSAISVSFDKTPTDIHSIDPPGGPYLAIGTKITNELIIESIRPSDKGYIIRFK